MTDSTTSTAKGPKPTTGTDDDAETNAPTARMISEQPRAAGTPATFDLGAAYAAAEQEESRLVASISDRKAIITSARAAITADEQALKDVRRFLSSRTPRKVNRAAK